MSTCLSSYPAFTSPGDAGSLQTNWLATEPAGEVPRPGLVQAVTPNTVVCYQGTLSVVGHPALQASLLAASTVLSCLCCFQAPPLELDEWPLAPA